MVFQISPRTIGFHICGILLSLCLPIWSQQTNHPALKKGVINPKCAFLRSDSRRIGENAQDYISNSPFAAVISPDALLAANQTIDGWVDYVAATEEFTAHRTILSLAFATCERETKLSDLSRLSVIENARVAQIRHATQRWQNLAGEQGVQAAKGITDRINTVYEAETKSFYSPSMAKFDDPDIGKDYPDLSAMIQGSTLDQGTKDFYATASQFLKYEEAGKLANILRGFDKEQSLNYAYLLRKTLAERATLDANQRSQFSNEQRKERINQLMHFTIEGLAILLLLILLCVLLWVGTDPARAKYRAFRHGLKRSPFWFGNAEWIFWEPGETVVLLEHKHLIPMTDTQGGYRIVSAWKGQEYKGRISYKTQFSTWKSDPIITSDGLPINLGLGIWWRIANAKDYVSKIASDYHEGERHRDENLAEAAEFWIKKLAAGTLRQEVNQLPAEKLISP
jgi:hypothetical protein